MIASVSTAPALLCPHCRTALPSPERWPDNQAQCASCHEVFRNHKGVLRFVREDAYTRSFSYEWNKHRKTLLDAAGRRSGEESLKKFLLSPDLVQGRRVLDAGCGTGRFTEVFLHWGAAHVTAVDLSQAVEVARENLTERGNITFAQADLMRLPFPKQSFDLILSWGVLHHTPNCAAAFRELAAYLKPGGILAVYIYGKSKGARRRMITFYRNITIHIPHAILYKLCYLSIPLYYAYRIPLLGNLLRFLVPASRQRDPRERVLDTFDEYSPRYASRHAFPEVYRWFLEAGMRDIYIADPPIHAVGRLPSPEADDERLWREAVRSVMKDKARQEPRPTATNARSSV
jgi:ubiquinone/menaquinone biosynthesis C-methylase UbiE